MSRRALDLTHQRFGRLFAFRRAANNHPSGLVQWICLCDCGRFCTATVTHLRNKAKRSCGCLAREVTSQRSTTHGFTRTHKTEYEIWIGAKKRCENPNNHAYYRYAGRGIKFLLESPQTIIDAIGPRPSNLYTLDRINNDGHYEANNIRWATYQEQARNSRMIRISKEIAEAIRTDRAAGLSLRSIREKHNTTRAIVYSVLSRKTWN